MDSDGACVTVDRAAEMMFCSRRRIFQLLETGELRRARSFGRVTLVVTETIYTALEVEPAATCSPTQVRLPRSWSRSWRAQARPLTWSNSSGGESTAPSSRSDSTPRRRFLNVKAFPSANLVIVTGASGGLETYGASGTSRSNPLGAVDTGQIAIGPTLAVIHRRTAAATNQVAWSTNGTAWTAATLPGSTGSTRVTAVAYMPNPALFVATVVDAAAQVAIYSSADGATWVKRTVIAQDISSISSFYPLKICVGPVGASVLSQDFAAALPGDTAYFRRFWTSVDGVTWTATADYSVPAVLSAVHSGGFYFASKTRRMFVAPTDGVLYRSLNSGLL